jgi:hypothetical protein
MKLKPSSVGLTTLDNGVMAWGISPSKYVQQAVANCARHLSEKLDNKYEIPRWADNPFPQDYRPKLDCSETLDAECSSFYQPLIGIMHWMVEPGRVDIATKVSLLSSHLPTWPCCVRDIF